MTAGNNTNQKIHEAVTRVERELQQVIGYINDEVVPTVHKESTRALRIAADKLVQLADYMEQAKKQP